MTTATATAVTATLPVVRAMLDDATRRRYTGGVLGVQARPEWDGPERFDHYGVEVRVVACPSTLAVREALLDRAPDRWLVVLTDRDTSELGRGITAHLVWHRLRPPDAWAAVRDRFGATQLDHRLVTGSPGRELATGLLAATPPQGWPPAPGGLLTADHAFSAVGARLGLGSPGETVDLPAVLAWSARADAATAIADLRATAGDPLVDTLLGWVADRCGSGGQAIGPLLRDGRAGDLVPLGLVARPVLAAGPGSGPRALLGREVGAQPSEQVLTVWATEAEAVARLLITDHPDDAARVLARAEALLERAEAGSLAGESAVLRRGLTWRLAALGEALHRCTGTAATRAASGGTDVPLADATALGEVEEHRGQVEAHALAGHRDEVRVPRALAAVRLARWLALPVPTAGSGLGALVARHRDGDGWVDRATALAWTGVEDEALARGLRAVLEATRLRRAAHDAAFGRALAAHHERDAPAADGVVHLEDLLATTVLPLARRQPVLLVIADGMSQGGACEIVDDVVRRYETWLECVPERRDRRLAALAVLPSLTAVSRASLLCGELTVGEQDAERAGLTALARSRGVTARLFHKLSLETTGGGYALAHDVAASIDDAASTPLVACVLNTIDDALDRSDPGGTAWTADTVKHLRPLLERARRAGRVVVLTSDHGHVIERRQGRLQPAGSASSNRSRPYTETAPPGEGEVRVRGRRVLLHGGDAVLAVDETLRYGPLKAGYHGGAASAEVVVPVCVLAPGEAPPGWRLAPPQSPAWWRGPATQPVASVAPALVEPTPQPRRGADTLFDIQPAPAPPPAHGPANVADAVIASPAYRAQRRRANRPGITDEQLRQLLAALLAAPAQRLDAESAAAALGIAAVQLTGAVSQAQRLLNIEQYPVLSRDADGASVVLDVQMLREQFEVRP
jgi:PglZ domain-containing protein